MSSTFSEEDIDFEVVCSCGNGLCHKAEVKKRRGLRIIKVGPCENCLKDSYDEGYHDAAEEA